MTDSSETRSASFAELTRCTLAAVAQELGELACAILHRDADSLTFRAAPMSLGQRVLPWTRKVYRIHCAGASVHLSPNGQYHDLARGPRDTVMREVRRLLGA